MAYDPTQKAHQEWLGYVQPGGLVVSIPALLEAGAAPDRNVIPLHRTFLETLPTDRDGNPVPELRGFLEFAKTVLGWEEEDVAGNPAGPPLPDDLSAPVAEYGETLRPTFAVRDFEPAEDAPPWLLLGQELPDNADFDVEPKEDARHWQASPQARIERLLRETGVPIGLLVNSHVIRLVYAPRGESSGHITFRVADMAQVAGRPILAALHMLLSAARLFSMAAEQRLPALLGNSRKYQNLVSTKLAGQVLEALYELLRGFQAADDQERGKLLAEVLKTDPNQVYGGLLTVLLRLVFLLYAEDRNLLSSDPLFVNHYSIGGLFKQLQEDEARHHDTMDHRYGGWARLLTLFRLIWRGASHGELRIPPRRGYLFDPDRYPFLEGRENARSEEIAVPRVSDGVLHRVLLKLLILDGERLSYRTLDVEQIGSVYEAIMGFDLHVAAGPSIAVRAKKKHGAPATINLESLLRIDPPKRKKWMRERTDQDITGKAESALKSAETTDDLLAALDRRIARNITPNPVPNGAMIFQPSAERRRSGSHYTPRSLTSPIVEHTLGPVLAELGERPTPDQILALKVCDPAMGSGAFLVEACRQLGSALVKSWHEHNAMPVLPPDEDELLYAQRVVAQRCLYGVDKNPMATDLAKLALWLATLAKDHPFTFLDHSLRSGDSLVGLSARQIAAMHWKPGEETLFEKFLRERIRAATGARQSILAAREDTPYRLLEQKLVNADEALNPVRWSGDAAVAAFFAGKKPGDRETTRQEYVALHERAVGGDIEADDELRQAGERLVSGPMGVKPFHWEIEFPEVFQLDEHLHHSAGFDAIIGNPPFMGGNQISTHFGMPYFSWLSSFYEECGGICDLVAYFFRRSFHLLTSAATLGLISTKTIAEGETRTGSLRWICKHGGRIYEVVKRRPWPGDASVNISVVHIAKQLKPKQITLDGREVAQISSFLLHAGSDDTPARLKEQNPLFSQGTNPRSPGFIFDDDDDKCTAISEMTRIKAESPGEATRIFPYIGGEEVNQDPRQEQKRYIIDLDDVETEAELVAFPRLTAIVREKVKPGREQLSDNPNNEKLRRRWWAYHAARRNFYRKVRKKSRVLVNTQVSNHLAFSFQPSDRVFALTLNIYDLDSCSHLAVLQSRTHEVWARFLGSHMRDDLRYTPSTCFETFPFPLNPFVPQGKVLDALGRTYHEYRADLMQRNNEGLTTTYNRFHDPNERAPDIQKLRELHDEMDRAVLEAYDWSDLQPASEFFPEFAEDDEEEANSRRRRRYRYRWPDELHDEILARLLALNEQRAALEAEAEKATKPKYGSKPKARRRRTSAVASLPFEGGS